MLRLVVAAALLMMVLAGCSSSPPHPAPTPTVTYHTTATPAIVIDVPRTDTLHHLDAPHLAATLPSGGETIRVPVKSDYAPGQDAKWRLPRPDVLALSTTAHFWVDVEGTVSNAGTATEAGCFWFVVLLLEDSSTGSTQALAGECIHEGPVVATGIRDLQIELPTVDTTGLTGDHLIFGVVTRAVPAPGTTVEILTGTSVNDSTLSIAGIQLPLDTQTLLQ